MEKYTRRDTLANLIKSIYGITTVNYDRGCYEPGKYGIIIMNQNGLFDHLSYSVDQKSKFDAMFDITFNTMECYFEKKAKDFEAKFNRKTAIENAERYFISLGINISIFVKHEKEKLLFSKLIYKLISTELLPAIFNTDDSEGERETDDITANFTIAINNVKAVLESKDIVSILYRNAKMSDIETIYEKYIKDPKKESGLAICICTEDILALVIEPWDFEPSIEMYIAPKPNDICNSKEADFSFSIEQLKKLSLLFPIDGEAAFDFPNDIYNKQRAGEKVTINYWKNTASINFLPKYFYYVSSLNQYSDDFYNNSSMLCSEVTIYRNIIRKAADAIREKYCSKFKDYYENVLDSIINNIYLLTSVDYGYLFRYNHCEKPELKKALGNSKYSFNRLYDVLYDGEYNNSEIKALIIWFIEYSVGRLNKAIETIIATPHILGAGKASRKTESQFITKLRYYFSEYDILQYVTTIEACFDKLQKIEELFEANHSDVHNKIEEIGAYISIDIKTDFTNTKKKISEIELDEEVFKSFHQTLIKLTSILKENNNAPA
ncbi:MAG: hypothetical protein K6G20_11575 [Ruminococcus sp.]|nr:hypothetical protein [Ruminococcus sp.]